MSDVYPKLLPFSIPLITCNSLHHKIQTVQPLLVIMALSFFDSKTLLLFSTHHTEESLAGHFRSCFQFCQTISYTEAECYAGNVIDIDDLKAVLVSYLHQDNLSILFKQGSFKFCSNSLALRFRFRGCLSNRHVDYRRPSTKERSCHS